MLLKYRSYFIKKSNLFQKVEYFLSWHIKKFLYIFYIKILCANIIKFSTSDKKYLTVKGSLQGMQNGWMDGWMDGYFVYRRSTLKGHIASNKLYII